MPSVPRVSERTFYPALLEIIAGKGGSGVQEVQYNSEPDIQFELLGRQWLLSARIGESPSVVKDAFLQYLRHKEESGVEDGLLLLLPEEIRKTPPTAEDVLWAMRHSRVAVLVDAGPVKEEYRDRTFPDILDLLRLEVEPLLKKGKTKHYPLPLVLSLLRAQVLDVMSHLSLTEHQLLRIITDKALLTNLGGLRPAQAEDVGRFLAAYIFLSQVLFLRFFASVKPGIISATRPVTKAILSRAFDRVLTINYRPIYEINVLEAIGDRFLRDTFDLIWGLEVEKIRYELPGRLFHELMPAQIRKLLAAFYTRPQAAELLARLTVPDSTATVFDLACGSGTILVAAYRAKEQCWRAERKAGKPHRRFCEDDIFGADIMPFAVHLTSANLAAIHVEETIDRTQIIQGDSISLVPGKAYSTSLQLSLFGTTPKAKEMSGKEYDVQLRKVDVVAMNPPFTKVERGIATLVDMEKFKARTGGEVGLWGHFVFLADELLKPEGALGAVLPINVLRGRESAQVRDHLFTEWTVRYVLKPTMNYGFSEWAEYRDVILVAEKRKPRPADRVKFCLVKKNLTLLTEGDISNLARSIKKESTLRTALLDIHSEPLTEVGRHSVNMMWFCGVSDLAHRDRIVGFLAKFDGRLERFPQAYFREGYRPVPRGVSSFLFLTRPVDPSRVEEAFLQIERETAREVRAVSHLGARYHIERSALTRSLRTGIGLPRMDVTDDLDYVAHEPYTELRRVKSACGFSGHLDWGAFWGNVSRELHAVSTNIVTVHRINPYSPSTTLIAFVSDTNFSPSNVLNVVREPDPNRAKAVCVLLNSCLFFAYFFLLKEESTGRYINIRFYDLCEMAVSPPAARVNALARIFDRYAKVEFPALRDQFDRLFEDRYKEYTDQQRGSAQPTLWKVAGQPVRPADIRLRFDQDVCHALGVSVSADELVRLYEVFVKEMIVTRSLTKD